MTPKVERRTSCEICMKTFAKKSTLENHMTLHTGNSPYQCACCKKRFTTKGHLKMHKQIHSGSKQFECELCLKQFYQKANCKIHVLRHTVQGRPFKCDVCSASFKDKYALNRHVKNNHDLGFSGAKDCPFCQRKFITNSQFNVHILSHIEERPHLCKLCPFESITKRYLKIHLESRHLELDPKFECDLCSTRFYKKSSRDRHLVAHFGEKSCKCKSCGKAFQSMGELKQHEIVHSKKRAFQCHLCRKGFKRPGDLKHHMDRHSSLAKYPCLLCPKQFFRRESLQKHRHIHNTNEEKAYKFNCGVCQKGFKTMAELNSHMVKVHSKYALQL